MEVEKKSIKERKCNDGRHLESYCGFRGDAVDRRPLILQVDYVKERGGHPIL